MRVALFTETFLPKVDGIVTVTCLLLDHLAQRGIETLIIAPRLGAIDAYGRTRVLTVPAVTFPLYPELKLGPSNLTVYQTLKAYQPDVTHFIHPLMTGISGMWMAKRLRIPTLASFHLDVARMARHYRVGFLEPLTRWLTRTVFNAADFALAPSRLVLREMQALGVRRVGLWGRGVDADKFHPRHRSLSMRAELSGGNPDDVILLYVGRLSTEKQIEQLRPVLENVPGTRLALVGDGPARRDLQTHFANTPTTFMGYLRGERLAQAYASADVFVFPSALETFGLVVTEAMAAGLPVVASRVGGVTDVVQEGRTGYTFAVNDVPALIDGVARIAADRAVLAQMGQDARAFAETQTWPAMMDTVIEHYQRLAQRRA